MLSTERGERPRVVLVTRSIILDKEDRILLIKRVDDPDKYAAGLWEVPGGKLEEGKDITHASQDEVLEETGLLTVPVTNLAYIESEMITQGQYAGFPYVVIYGVSRISAGELRLSDEHDNSAGAPYEEIFDYPLKNDVKRALLALKPQFEK